MGDKAIQCDQAIHTSIRTAMGEGYRIVAASKGLRPQEKQAITRNSPSLDSICLPPDGSDTEPIGISFYRLPTKRLCVAYSCHAGEEHTGRGGRRVYTINVIFNATDFQDCGYNPFRIVRAMCRAGLTEPQLTPDRTLPEIELRVEDEGDLLRGAGLPATLPVNVGAEVLEQILSDTGVVVEVADDWTECAEAMLLGVPGPMREHISFCAGLYFSTSRKHRFQFIADPKDKAKARCSAIGATFVSSTAAAASSTGISDWAAMATRHWRDGRLGELSRRTSRPYDDTSDEARERLAAIFETLDDVPQIAVARLAGLASEILNHDATGAEKTVCEEFVAKVGENIIARISVLTPQETEILFTQLVSVWRQGGNATKFAEPVIDALLRATMRVNPLSAAQLALQIASDAPPEADRARRSSLIEAVLTQFAAWAGQTREPALAEVPALIKQWEAVHEHAPELARVAEHCSLVLAEISAAR